MGHFHWHKKTLARQAQKAIFKLNCYLIKYTDVTPKHILDLFDKLVSPILNYAAKGWVFFKATQIERVHLQFRLRLLWVKKTTQIILFMRNWEEQTIKQSDTLILNTG